MKPLQNECGNVMGNSLSAQKVPPAPCDGNGNREDGVFLYIINSPPLEEPLCNLEMKYLFHIENPEKQFFSTKDISPSRSPYIKHRLSVLYRGDSLEDLIRQLQTDRPAYDSFRFAYFSFANTELGYDEWMRCIDELGGWIDGKIDMEHPQTRLGLTKLQGTWILGEYEENDRRWQKHDKKPHTNSHSLKIAVAKALVNIAVGEQVHCRLIDPCCGVGTVVIEAVAMGIDVKGYDFNWPTAEAAKKNMAFLGYQNVITHGDMHKIEGHFDAAIVDIPYGLFTPVTFEEQREIISTAHRIADKVVFVTFEDMEEVIVSTGFTIVDRCRMIKGNFKRFVSVCC